MIIFVKGNLIMRRLISLSLTTMLFMLFLALPSGLRAEVVGRFIQVEGHVDVLKHGQVPAVTAKVQDGLEPGDVVRTKSEARAQIQFLDDTTLTLSPGSRVTIEEYFYDAAKGQRRGVIQVLRGMVQAVVTRVLQVEKPDFILKTHTAVMGVRGTKWYALLSPHATEVYNEAGKLAVSNILPEIAGEVILQKMEFTRVGGDFPPTVAARFGREDLRMLQHKLSVGPARATTDRTSGGVQPTGPLALSQVSLASLTAVFNPASNPLNNPLNINYVIPPKVKTSPTPAPVIPP
jgi:hypothetical protein